MREIVQSIYSIEKISNVYDIIIKLFSDSISQAHLPRKSRQANLVLQVKQYITKHYQDSELKISFIAKNIFVNTQYMCTIFKNETGRTIGSYLQEFRMNKAKELFDCGQHSITQVANYVGYEDANYFSKCFKKHFGVTPVIYLTASE